MGNNIFVKFLFRAKDKCQINENQYINDTYEKLIYSMDNGCHENQLNEQPALSPLVGISLIVLLNTPYKWIICSDICCTSIML
jgi:hypothetical protein